MRGLTVAIFGILILVVLVSRTSASLPADDAAKLAGRALAHEVVRLLAAGDFEEVARHCHYPPSYSPEMREKDIAGVADGLRLIFATAGKLSETRLLMEPEEFYFVAIGGGDLAYWQSRSPYHRAEYPYHAMASHFGSAIVKVVILTDGSRPGTEVVEVNLGLPVVTPGAKGKMIRLSLDLLDAMKVPTPSNIEELVSQGMERTLVSPASPASAP